MLIIFLISIDTFSKDLKEMRSVSVTGNCSLKSSPDKGSVLLTVREVNKNLSKSNSIANERYNRLVKRVKGLKLKGLEVSTNNYSVREKNRWEKGKSIFEGHITEISLEVETSEIDKIGKVIKTGNDEKVDRVGSLRTFMSDIKLDNLDHKCLEIASKKAKKKADKLAKTLGAKVSKVLKIYEGEKSSPPVVRDTMMMKASRSKMSAPQIQTKNMSFKKNITVIFELI